MKGEVINIKPWDFYLGQTRIVVHSPVEVQVYDEFGNHVGPNSTGGFDLEIQGSNYTEIDGELALIFPTTSDRFLVVLKGNGNGEYGMDISRPILVRLADGTDIVQEVTYHISGISTNLLQEDYYYFDFGAIERAVNEKISSGEGMEDAINHALQELVVQSLVAQKPATIISVEPQYGTVGEIVEIGARLMSFSSPVTGKDLMFYVDGEEIGMNLTDLNGTTLAYSSGLPAGIHELKVAFEEDENYLGSESISTIDIEEKPFSVSLDVPLYVEGVVDIKGSVEGSPADEQSILIDRFEVSSDQTYEWDSADEEDGLHTIEFYATNSEGESANAIKIVYVGNNKPEVSMNKDTFKEGQQVILFVRIEPPGDMDAADVSIDVCSGETCVSETPHHCLIDNSPRNFTCMYQFRAGSPGSYTVDAKLSGIMIAKDIAVFTVSPKKN